MSDLEPFQKRIGTTLRGKWTLERLLGVGGMAAVYAAVHKIGRREAIKILHPEVASSREIAERFEQEAHVVNRFRHPGAVEVRDHDVTEDGAPFLVMELLEGESLGQRMVREAVPLADALRYADELLDVLAAAHAEGIIHRDVKPDNLFVTREGRLKVLDFGIARMLEGSPRSVRTAVGLAMGTPHYMPPEQVLGGKVDPRADLYAVGATLFRLVAGRHAHAARADMDLFVKVATEPAPPLCSVAPQAPVSLGLVVDRALSRHPDDRYPDARMMQGDVQALRRGDAPPFASAHPPTRAAGPAHDAPTAAGVAFAARTSPTVAAVPAPAIGDAPTQAPPQHIATQAPPHQVATQMPPHQTAAQAPAHPTNAAALQTERWAPAAGPPAATFSGQPAGLAPAGGSTFGPTPAATAPGAPFAIAPLPPKAPSPRRAGLHSLLGDRQRAPLFALGALALVGLLVVVGGIWLFSGDDAESALPDPSLPSPVPTGGEADPPGAGGGAPGARPPTVGAPPAAPPRIGPQPVGRPPALSKERERELEKEREKERKRQREREKEGRKK